MSTLRVFKSTIPSINFIFGNGKPAIFQGGVFRTDIPSEISALEYEIAQGHPHIFIDPNEREVDSELLDPMKALRAKIREEILAEEAEKARLAADVTRDMGTSDQSAVKPASTLDIAPAAAGGSGASLVASLANIKIGK
jgi:hypothetical protein